MEEMMTITKSVVWMLVMALGFATSGAWAQHSEHGALRGAPPEHLGEVNFPVSCSAAAQKDFNRAMALFHSFGFEPAKESFAKALERDPECGMAYWGIAIMSMGNPFAWPPNANAMKAGAAAMVEAQRVGAKSERERDYIAALATYFKDWETRDHRTRAVAFEKAMEGLVVKCCPHLCQDRARGATCSAHALAHLQPGRPLAGNGGEQPRLLPCRQE
jgi:hypothetical protein